MVTGGVVSGWVQGSWDMVRYREGDTLLGTGWVVYGWVQGGFGPHTCRRHPPALELVDVEEEHAIREALPVWGFDIILIVSGNCSD